MTEGEKMRLFIGLPVESAAADALSAYAETLSDCRVVPKDMYHITLCFLGCRPREEMEGLKRILDDAPRPQLRLRLGETGSFKNGDILWAGLQEPPQALFDLQNHLARALDMEEDYTPHITLARKAQKIAAGFRLPDIGFSPDRIILYESLREDGILRYRPRYEIELHPGSNGKCDGALNLVRKTAFFE